MVSIACSTRSNLQADETLIPATVSVPAGSFVFGSDQAEREYAYHLDEQAYGHSRTRDGNWYGSEPARSTQNTNSYAITTSPITNEQYLYFVNETAHESPDVDAATWNSYGLIHPFNRTRRHAWTGNAPPADRLKHPVVLVSYGDANSYAQWLSKTTGANWRLPTEHEWVKAARGSAGNIFPWGDEFIAANLNSHDAGPFDTVEIGTLSKPSPFGLIDAAGQVFEWVSSPGTNRAWVKGGSWDDKGCGVCRPAARHNRPRELKHILIGFRLVRE